MNVRSGFLSVIKPPGMTSQDVVSKIRRSFPKGTRVGHMGTLDPDALGVLPIGIGKAARLFEEVVDKKKTYVAEMCLGIATDTQDASGSVLQTFDLSGAPVSNEALTEVIVAFTGDILQIPPAYSAVKKDGKRLYALAREGLDTDVPPRPARIDAIQILSFHGDTALLRIECGRGTYIRTLLHDMGQRLGCGAHMAYLVRTASGPFTMKNSLLPDECAKLCRIGKAPFFAMDFPLEHLPKACFSETLLRHMCDGKPLPAPENVQQGTKCRVYAGSEFMGIAKCENSVLRFQSMLWEARE